MKIVQIITQMEAGGAQRMMYLLGEELIRAGHTVETWFLYKKRPAYDGMPGVRVVLDRCPSGVDYLTIIGNLAKMLRAEKPDVLITHTYYSNAIGQLIGRACQIRRGIAVQHSPMNTFPKAGRFLDWLAGSLGVYTVNIAVADAVFRSANRYPLSYRRRLLTIYNGVPKPVPSGSPEDIRARWNLPLEKSLLIHVGRISRQKNQEFLLDVIARLPHAHLVFVGDGELRDDLMNQIDRRDLKDRVHYMGEVGPESVHDLVSASDVFVFPSRFEAMSMVLLETMHLGVPIVASDIPPNRDLLRSTGILLPINDPELWASEVSALLGCREIAAKLGADARMRVKDLTATSMATSYCKLLA